MDFHWGEYTYNLAGGGEIFLSELLNILADGAENADTNEAADTDTADIAETDEIETVSDSGTDSPASGSESVSVYDSAELAEIAADMSRVANVSFSDPELLQVERKSSEQAENDWLLTSLAAFDTEETLTIRLTNGEEIVVRVTDAVEVTIDGVTYTLNTSGSTAGTATVKATGTDTSQIYVIKNTIEYGGTTYIVKNLGGAGSANDKIYNGKKVILEDALVSAITQNSSLVLPADNPAIVDNIPDAVSSMLAGEMNSTGLKKLWKQTTVLDEDRVQIDLSFFQSRKTNDAKIGFIFLLDETDTMAGSLPAGVAPAGYTMQRRLYSRSLLKMFSDSILGTDNRMAMVIYGDFGSNEDRFKTTGICTPEEFKVNIFDNYISGAAGGAGLRSYIGPKMLVEVNAMKALGYTPVIITLSDFAWGDSSTDFNNIDCNKYAVGIIDGNAGHRLNWTKIGTRTYSDRAYKGSDLESFISAMENIFLDAISSISKDTKVTDELSSPLQGTITSLVGTQTDNNGKLTISSEGMTWEFVDANGNSLPAGVLYTKQIICDLSTKNEIISGNALSNENCNILNGTVEINRVDSPILKSPVTLILKGTDTSGSALSGATFTLTRGSGTWDLTTDAGGRIVLPWGENDTVGATTAESTFAFPVGAEYTLTQNTTVSGFVRPAGSWTLTVGNDYKITATAAQGSGDVNRTRNLEAHAGKFEIYNDASPKVIYHYNQPTGTQTTQENDQIEFAADALSRSYTLGGVYNTQVPGYVFTGWALSETATAADYQEGEEITVFAKGTGAQPDPFELYAVWAEEGDLVPLVIEKKWDESIDWTKEPYASQKAENATIEFKVYGKTDPDDSGTLITAYTTAAGTTPVSTISATDSEGSVSEWAKKVYVPKSITESGVEKVFTSYRIEETDLKIAEGSSGTWAEPIEEYQEGIDEYVEKTTDQLPAGVQIYQPSSVNGVNLDLRLSGAGSIRNITSVTIEYTVNNGQYYFQTKALFSSAKTLESSSMGKWEHIYRLKLLTNANGYKPVFRKLYINDVEQQVGPGNWISSAVIDTGGNNTSLWTGEDLDVSGSDSTVTYYIHEIQDRKLTVTNSFMLTDAIARVSNDDGATWKYFDALITGTYDGEDLEGAFDYAAPLTGNVIIETLKETHERYTLGQGTTFDKAANITLRTTQDDVWNPVTGEGEDAKRFTTTLYRGYDSYNSSDNTQALLTAILAVNNANTTLTVEHITMDGDKDGTATGTARTGRGIYVNMGKLHILEGTTMQNFKFDHGSAVFTHSTHSANETKIENALFTNCEATTTSGTEGGGAVHVKSGKASITGTTFVDCVAAYRGGALFTYPSDGVVYTIDDCTFIGHNQLDASKPNAKEGGGYYVWNGSPTVTNTTFIDCYTTGAGGAMNMDGGGSDKFVMRNCKFYGHQNLDPSIKNSGGKGGGLHINANSGITLSSLEFYDCTSNGNGGGVNSDDGGAVLSGKFICINCRSENGTGGGLNLPSPSGEMVDSEFTNCYAKSNGGGAYLTGGITVKNSTITDCRSKEGYGGGMYVGAAGTTNTFIDCTFIGHDTLDGATINATYGGALYVADGALTLSRTPAGNDTPAGNGTTFEKYFVSSDGGAIYQNGTGALTADHVRFTECKAGTGNKGGVIYTLSANVTLEDSTFCAGATQADTVQTAKLGGAIYQTNTGGRISLTRTDIYGYQATAGGGQGGAVWSNATELNMDTVNIQNNKAEDNGGGIYSGARTVGIRNTLNVTGNALTKSSLTTAEKTHAAGIYFTPEDTIITVTSDSETAHVYIYGNQLSNGKESNLKMGVGAPALEIQDGTLTRFTGKVGVVNPAVIDRWFGRSVASAVCGTATPAGAENPVDAIFKDDTGVYTSQYIGIEKLRLIWGPLSTDYVCKITDASGNLLEYDFGEGLKDAVFTSLSDAFGALGDYVASADKDRVFNGTPAYVKMLEKGDDYKLSKIIYVPDNLGITLTTASHDDTDGYPGPADDIATVSRQDFYGSMFVMRGQGSNTSTFTVENIVLDGGGSTYKNDTYNQNGGIIRADGDNCALTLSSGAELRNSVINGNNHNGGAVYMAGGRFTMHNPVGSDEKKPSIHNCSAVNGGAVYLNAGSGHSINDSVFTDNAAPNGGSVFTNATLTVVASTFRWNTPTSNTASYGGGIYVAETDASLNVTGSEFIDLKSSNVGGAIYGVSRGDITIEGSSFTWSRPDQNASAWGGAIGINDDKNAGELIIRSSSFTGIRASSRGGAIYTGRKSKGITLDDVTFTSCTSSGSASGGAIGARTSLSATKVTFEDCHAGYAKDANGNLSYGEGLGGAIYMEVSSSSNAAAVLDNVTITGCSAYMGGAIYSSKTGADALTLKNGTSITDNYLNPNAGTRNHAGGVYMVNNGLLTVGASGITEDGTTISGNTTATGEPSNLRLSSLGADGTNANNSANSLKVLSALTGEIHVVNPGNNNTQFGIENPNGTYDVPAHIISDQENRTAERRDNNQLWWAGIYVCKITDAAGNTLQSGGSDAVYCTLTEAFAAFPNIAGAKHIEIFRPLYNEVGYEGVGVYKMEAGISYPTNKAIQVILKTAPETAPDGKYPYIKNGDADWERILVLRGNVARTASMFNLAYANSRLDLEDIVLDGQCDKGQFNTGNGGAVYLDKGAALGMSRLDENGVTENANCEIRNAQGASGGGVFNYYNAANSVTEVEWWIVKGCVASNGKGGGLYTKTYVVEAENSAFIKCRASGDGGGIAHEQGNANAYVTLTDSSFINCSASGSGNGGSVWSNAASSGQKKLTVKGCTFIGHDESQPEELKLAADTKNAGGTGGAIYSSAKNTDVEDYVITDPDTGAKTVRQTTFSNFSATTAGTMWIDGSAGGTVNIRHCIITHSRATGDYGAVDVHGRSSSSLVNGTLNVEGTIFSDCSTSGGYGGALSTDVAYVKIGDYTAADGSLTHSAFTDCHTYGSNGYGGAVLADGLGNGSSLTVTNVPFSDCTNVNNEGGAVYTRAQIAAIGNCTFTNCRAQNGSGGAFAQNQDYNSGSTLTLANCVFTGYSAKNNGGAVYSIIRGEMKVFGCTFNGSGATGSDGASRKNAGSNGGAIYSNALNATIGDYVVTDSDTGEKTVTRSTFSNNSAATAGSVYFYNTVGVTATLQHCSFTNSSATGSYGCVNVSGNGEGVDGTLTVEGCEFSDCTAASYGGGLCTRVKTVTMGSFTAEDGTETKTSFTNCRTTGSNGYGGGAMIDSNKTGSSLHATDVSFTRCSAQSNGGGGLDTRVYDLELNDCSFTDCSAKNSVGGGLHHRQGNGTAELTGCSFTRCIAETNSSSNGGGLYAESPTTVTSCTFDGCEASNQGGGAFFNNNATLEGTADNPTVIQNGSAQKGSAIWLANSRTLNLNGGWASGDDAKAGISIGGNTATNKDGGAINVGGNGAKLIFDGNVVVQNNQCSASNADGKQHNVLLDQDQGATPSIIQTSVNGLGEAAMIGVYAINTKPYNSHGKADKDFGLFPLEMADNTVALDSLVHFVNDRHNLTGTANMQTSGKYLIRWSVGYVCKLTDDNGNILYRDSYAHKPAVFKSLQEGMEWASANADKHVLYMASKAPYDWTDPIQLKLLTDVALGKNETAVFTDAARKLTITTAGIKEAEEDNYPYIPYTEDATDPFASMREDGKAVIISKTTEDGKDVRLTDSMFVISNARTYSVFDHMEYDEVEQNDGEGNITTIQVPREVNREVTDVGDVYVSNLVIDGTNQNVNANINGGAIRINEANTLGLADVSFQNITASNGGAIYVANDIEMLTSGSVTFYKCTATGGSGSAGASGGGGINTNHNLKLTNSGTLTFDNCVATKGQGGGMNVYGSAANDSNLKYLTDPDMSPQITNTGSIVFTDCSSASDAGALGVQENHLTIDNRGDFSFTDCTVNKQEGGAINIDSGILTVKNAANAELSFTRCTAPDTDKEGRGGAIYAGALMAAENAGKITIDSCESGYAGGAIYLNKADNPNGGQGNLVIVAGVEDGFTITNCETGGNGGSGRNGGAIYVKGNSSITATAANAVSITGNHAAYTGGAIHLPDGASMTLNVNGGIDGVGISITGNSSSATNGGAVNVGGTGSSLNFGGNVWIYDNLEPTTNAQKNVVLAHDSNAVINTTVDGLGENARIGIYAVGTNASSTVFGRHGQYQQDFGTIGASTTTATDPETGEVTSTTQTGDQNLNRFTNDRNGLYGEACPVSGHETLIRWQSYLCKLTTVDVDANGIPTANDRKLLYYKDSGDRLWPAVYDYLKTQTTDGTPVGGFTAAEGELYTASGTAYNGTAIRVEMLKDYSQPSNDQPTVTGSRSVTFTTSQTEPTSDDVYIYNKVGSVSLDKTATITRASDATTGSMFTVDNAALSLTTTNLVFDGNLVVPTTNVNGGIVKVESGTLNVNESTTMRKSIAKNGGAVYLGTGSLVATGGTTDPTRVYITDCRATGNGGAIYDGHSTNADTSIDTVKLENVTIDGHTNGGLEATTANAANGGAIYILDNTKANLNTGGSARLKDCTILDCWVSERGGAIYSGSVRRIPLTDETKDEPTVHLLHTVIDGHDSLPYEITVNGTTTKLYNAQRGGAILLANGTLELEADDSGNSDIRDCTVSQYGGAIDSYGEGTQYKGTELPKTNDYSVKLKNTTITNCSADIDGGGINIRAILTLLDSTITGCSAGVNGGAIRTYGGWDNTTNKPKTTTDSSIINMNVGTNSTYHNSTITGNTAGTSGAGIYLLEGAKLNLAGAPNFGGTAATGANINTVGTRTSAKRQDIYIAGYLGTESDGETPRLAESLIVTGALNLAKGSIWVGAEVQDDEDNNHWDGLKQFAKFAEALMSTDASGNPKVNLTEEELTKVYETFRNATTSEEYYGTTGDNIQCIYWEGVQGSRKVILRKVSTTYVSLPNAQFEIKKGSKLITGTDVNGEAVDGTTKTAFTSGQSGVFYIGMMDYGVYVLHETMPPSGYSGANPWYYLIVDEDGAVMSDPSKENQAFAEEALAKSAGDALFKQRQTDRKTAAQQQTEENP